MKAPRFAKLFAELSLLNQPQRLLVLEALHPAAGLDRVVALIDGIRSPGRRCPHCSSGHLHRHGQANNLQRFRCRQCGRTFNDLTGTPLARLRLKGKWLDYVGALLDSRTVRAAAKQVGVHRNTAFRWRHRFLDRAKHDRPAQLTGIVEADETFLLDRKRVRASSIASRASAVAGLPCAGSRVISTASSSRATAADRPSTPSRTVAP